MVNNPTLSSTWVTQVSTKTWSQYARSTIGYALDRVAQLEKLQLLLLYAILFANATVLLLLNDEVNDDAVDNSLITLVGSLSSQITTWQTRIKLQKLRWLVELLLENN